MYIGDYLACKLVGSKKTQNYYYELDNYEEFVSDATFR